MNIEAFLLCDCATEGAGKLNVLGAFDNIYSGKMPSVHPSCTIAARIRFEKIENGNHKLRVAVIDQDGKEIVPRLDGSIPVQIGNDVDSAVINIVLNLQRLRFEKYGEYRIDLAIDGKVEGSLPFTVRKVPNQT